MKRLSAAALGLLILYGVVFALWPILFMQTNIDAVPQEMKSVREDTETTLVAYRTDGPTFTSFSNLCYDDYNDGDCIVLKSDGKPGLVELNIPTSELTGTVNAVKVGWFHERDVRFDLIKSDETYNTIRFAMPVDQDSVRIHSGWLDPYLMPVLLGNLWMLLPVLSLLVSHLKERLKGRNRLCPA